MFRCTDIIRYPFSIKNPYFSFSMAPLFEYFCCIITNYGSFPWDISSNKPFGLLWSSCSSLKCSNFLKGDVSMSLKLMFLWRTVIKGKEWGSHRYMTVRLGCCYCGKVSISLLRSLRIKVPPVLVDRVKIPKRETLTSTTRKRSILDCSSRWKPLIDSINKRGIRTKTYLCYLWVETDRISKVTKTKRDSSQYFFPSQTSTTSTFPSCYVPLTLVPYHQALR